MRSPLLLVLLAACHVPCGNNTAVTRAEFLDPKVQCDIHVRMQVDSEDYALCRSGSDTWFCTGGRDGCRTLGPRVTTVVP